MEHRQPDKKKSTTLILVDDSSVSRLGARPPLHIYLRQLWGRRSFILMDARARAFQGHRGMWLGKLWIILNPLVEAATYGLIFGLLLRTSRGIDNFVGYLILGISFFAILQQGLNGGAGLIQSSRSMIAAFRFPRASLVLGLTIRQFLDNIAPAAMAVVVAYLGQLDKGISLSVVIVVPVFFLMHVFCAGLSFLVSFVTAFVPDFKAALRVISRGWFYISGVFFSVETFATHPTVRALMEANPGYQFLAMVRTSVLDGSFPSLSMWSSSAAWAFGTFVVGFVVFWSAEARYVKTL